MKRQHLPSVLRPRSRVSSDPDYKPGRFEPGYAAAYAAAREAPSGNVTAVTSRALRSVRVFAPGVPKA